MKCRLLAHRLGHEEFKQWVIWESDGYPKDASVPDYRKVSTNLKMVLYVPYMGTYDGLPVPISAIPSQLTNLREVKFGNGISSLEEMVATGGKVGTLRLPLGWMAHEFQRLNNQCAATKLEGEILDLWRVISTGQVANICNTVCGRVLDFTVEIQKKLPNAGELSGDSPTLDDCKRVVNQIFNTTVNKGGSINMMGTAIDSAVINITAGNFDGLSKVLADNGFSPENINLLRDALDADKDGKLSDGFGPKVSEWLSKMMAKVANRSLDVSVDFLIKAITQYYGGA